jgi:hypothetical protein
MVYGRPLLTDISLIDIQLSFSFFAAEIYPYFVDSDARSFVICKLACHFSGLGII